MGTLRCPPVELNAEQRFVVDATIREVCAHRRWHLHAVHARTTHVHSVVFAPHTPERVMNDFKAYATRRMREARVLALGINPWAYHGSTRYLSTEHSRAQAIHYVLHEQGEPLEMRCPIGWRPKFGTQARRSRGPPQSGPLAHARGSLRSGLVISPPQKESPSTPRSAR